jgi:hypothetical protein
VVPELRRWLAGLACATLRCGAWDIAVRSGLDLFSRPFADFDPGPAQLEAGRAVREFIVGRVRRCIGAGILRGNETDIAHVLLALAQGLAAQEIAGWLGTSPASVQRRWDLAIRAVLDGLTPAPDDGVSGA